MYIKLNKVSWLPFSGSTEIDVDRGDISVVSASGKLKAVTTTGNVNVNLSYHDDVMLKSKEGNYESLLHVSLGFFFLFQIRGIKFSIRAITGNQREKWTISFSSKIVSGKI